MGSCVTRAGLCVYNFTNYYTKQRRLREIENEQYLRKSEIILVFNL